MCNQEKSYLQHAGPSAGLGFAVVDAELDNADREPSLGSLACIPTYDPRFGWYRSQDDWADGGTTDLEDEHDGREPEDYFA